MKLVTEPNLTGVPAILLLAGSADESLSELRSALDGSGAPACRLAAFGEVDWNADYTPWPLDAPNGRHFDGRADALLPSVETAIEKLRAEGASAVYLVGYSLGGLAAMYFASQLPVDGVASCSGSLWYPGFVEYLRKHSLCEAVYLSIGGKEKNTHDELMKNNEDCTAEVFKLCQKTAGHTVFNHEPGGHFRDPSGRMARGIMWLIQSSAKQSI